LDFFKVCVVVVIIGKQAARLGAAVGQSNFLDSYLPGYLPGVATAGAE